MPDLFKDIVPSILRTKKNVMVNEQDYKEYKPYVVNKALSFHHDCIPYVQEMNLHAFLDKDIQYNYYLHSIRSMDRKFKKWEKADEIKDLQAVKTYFGYSNEKAKQALRILTKQQIDYIKKLTDTGGVKN